LEESVKKAFDRRISRAGSDERKVQTACVALRDYIRRNYKEGDALMPVRQLTRELGVSITTVCGALNQLGLAGLLEVRHGERTRVTAAALRARVGILAPDELTHPSASVYTRMLVHHLLGKVDGAGFDVSFYGGLRKPWSDDRKSIPWNFINDARCGHLDAAIVLSDDGTAGVAICESLNIPIVGSLEDCSAFARFDFGGMVRSSLAALAEAGCRRMAIISWAGGGVFEDGLNERGLPVVPQWVKTGTHPSLPEAGYRLFGEVWDARREKPDGLLVMDDVYVPGVVRAIRERRIRVPQKLKVIAHSNKGNRFDYPFPVTLMENDPELQAEGLLDALLVKMGQKPQEAPVRRFLESMVVNLTTNRTNHTNRKHGV